MTSQASWYAEGLTPSIDRTLIATDIESRQLPITPVGAYIAISGHALNTGPSGNVLQHIAILLPQGWQSLTVAFPDIGKLF